MQVTYCRRWNFRRPEPIDTLTADEARKRGENDELYTAALGDPAEPEAVIEVNWRNDHLGVWWFERHLRQSVHFAFRRVDATSMFLQEITNWRYPDATAKTLSGATYIQKASYEPDGIVRLVIADDAAGETVTEERSGVNVDNHIEPVPVFGEWDSVARFNRDQPSA